MSCSLSFTPDSAIGFGWKYSIFEWTYSQKLNSDRPDPITRLRYWASAFTWSTAALLKAQFWVNVALFHTLKTWSIYLTKMQFCRICTPFDTQFHDSCRPTWRHWLTAHSTVELRKWRHLLVQVPSSATKAKPAKLRFSGFDRSPIWQLSNRDCSI